MGFLSNLWPFRKYTYHSKGSEGLFEKTPHQWILATNSILSADNGVHIDLIGGMEPTPSIEAGIKMNLKSSWGVNDSGALLETLKQLEENSLKAQDKKLLAWDGIRLVHLAQWGYLAGYLQESEVWKMTLPTAKKLQESFDSWQDLGENYLSARSQNFSDNIGDEMMQEAFLKLLKNPASPWVQVGFKAVEL